MSKDIIREIVLFNECLLCGVAFGLIYDFFRILRRLMKHNRLMIDMEDLLYWLICFWISFCLLYYANDNIIGFFCVMAAAIGMWIYSKTLGKVLVKMTCKICDMLFRPIRVIKNKLTKMTKHFTIILRRKEKGEGDIAKE